MSAIVLRNFSGERPRVTPTLLPAGGAQSARDVRLDDGALTPLREALLASAFSGYVGGYKTIYRFNSTWLGWTTEVNAVPGPVANDRLYITGDGVPKMKVGGTTYNLAVPFPTSVPTATPSGTGSGPIEARVYVYTFVTAYGEESEPSPATSSVNWQSGITITLSNIDGDPGGRNITLQRFYRTQTGDNGTDLYFIAERAVSSSDFVDNIANDAFGEVLPSRAYNQPPDGLAGLVAMPNGMMAAFDANSPRNLYFCEPYLPHAWPEPYVLTTDADIVALGVIGTSLIILTKGNPYLAQGTDPASMQMVKTESNLPCVNARGVQDLGFGIAYPSHEGLALATGDGGVRLVTEALFNRQEWQAFSPATICAGQLSGLYIASYDTVGADGNTFSGSLIIHPSSESAFLSRSNVVAQAFYFDVAEGGLYYLVEETGAVMRFDPPGGTPISQYWKSRPTLLAGEENMGVIRIDGVDLLTAEEQAAITAAHDAVVASNTTLLASPLGSEVGGEAISVFEVAGDPLQDLPASARTITVGVYANDVLVKTVDTLGKALRLPSGFLARKWEVDVFGTVQVQQIAMARNMAELRNVGAA